MIKCLHKPIKRFAIEFIPINLAEITKIIGSENLDSHLMQDLVNTKRHGWQNVNFGDYLIFDEDNRLIKVINSKQFKKDYEVMWN